MYVRVVRLFAGFRQTAVSVLQACLCNIQSQQLLDQYTSWRIIYMTDSLAP